MYESLLQEDEDESVGLMAGSEDSGYVPPKAPTSAEEAQEKGMGTVDCACLVVYAAGTARGGCLVARCQCRLSDSSRWLPTSSTVVP